MLMDYKALGVVLGCALVACSGRTSIGGLAAEAGGTTGLEPELRTPLGASGQAGQPSVPADGSAGSGARAEEGSGSGGTAASTGGTESAGTASGGTIESAGAPSSPAGEGGSDEPAPEFPVRGVCGPTVNEYSKQFCPELDSLSIQLDAIEDKGGDGSVSPGEDGYLVFSISNNGPTLADGPCVGVMTAIPGLTVLEPYNPMLAFYGLLPNSSVKKKIRFRVEPSVPPGTRIPLQAWLDMHDALCPNGGDAVFELRVGP